MLWPGVPQSHEIVFISVFLSKLNELITTHNRPKTNDYKIQMFEHCWKSEMVSDGTSVDCLLTLSLKQ